MKNILMRILALLIVWSFSISGLNAQTSNQQNRRKWSEGPLTWEDFREQPSADEVFAHLAYGIQHKSTKLKQHDTVFTWLSAESYIDTSKTWVDPGSKTDKVLLYNQVIFDIAELYARKYNNAIRRKQGTAVSSLTYIHFTDVLNERIEAYAKATAHGQDGVAVVYWSDEIKKEIAAEPLVDHNSLPEVRRFGYGIQLGFGGSRFTSSLSEYFRTPISLSYGFDFSYGRTVLYIDGTLGGTKTKQAFDYDGNHWNDGQKSGYAVLKMALGYRVISNKRLMLAPYGGYGLTEFTFTPEEDKEHSINIDRWNWQAGLSADILLRKHYNYTYNAFTKHGEFTLMAVRTNVFLTRVNIPGLASGNAINFALAFVISGHGLRPSL